MVFKHGIPPSWPPSSPAPPVPASSLAPSAPPSTPPSRGGGSTTGGWSGTAPVESLKAAGGRPPQPITRTKIQRGFFTGGSIPPTKPNSLALPHTPPASPTSLHSPPPPT